MQLRYNYRLYPAPGQRQALAKAFGCARVVFNDALRVRQEAFAAGLSYPTDAERRLRKAQKALSRTERGSRNRDKARIKVARVHARVAVTRRDWLHKESTRIIRESQAVYVEDLCVAGLGRTRLAKSVHDAGWSAFTRMLEYKAHRHGRTFGKVGRFEPTSQVCSACGVNGGPKPLSVRTWTCAACGAVHDRDVNAARNIVTAGRAGTLNACGDGVRPGLALAAVGETGTRRSAA